LSFTGKILSQTDYKSEKSNSPMLGELLEKNEILPDLAEACGIHAGDGYLRNDGKRRELDISGGLDEQEYYDAHVIPLFEKVFNVKMQGKHFKSRGTYGFVIRKKEVIEFMHSLGFPYGKKTLTVRAPEFVMSSRNLDIIYRFVRGLFDTDGSLNFQKKAGSNYLKIEKERHCYPRIQFTCCSKQLRDDLSALLKKTGFQFREGYRNSKNPNEKPQFGVCLLGYQNLENWMFNIGLNNTSKLSRFRVWRAFSFCPPNTTFMQRKQILNKELDPNLFYMGP